MLKRLTNFSLKMFIVLFPSEKPLLFTGVNSTIQLASLASASGSKRPLLVTEKFLLKLGLLDGVLERFKNEGCEVTVFDGVIPNPSYKVIEDGIRACKENDCDSIFAVGGGSTIDAAKVIAACCSNDVGVEQDAKLAIKLLLEHLPVVYKDGNNLEARQLVSLASFLAAYAFNKSGLGYVHAISHQLSAHYNTPHGLTNAIILPQILRFNKPVCADRFANLEQMLSGVSVGSDEQLADRFIKRVDALGQQLNIPSRFKELETKHYEAITRNALKEAKLFYAVPRLMSPAQCKNILTSIAAGATAASPGTETSQVIHAI
ncbi:MAG: iron-containing alcohol dehydrogenase [Symploca sp. SIO2C1]|nr:iron-containing alcohol dehydrogenase [Symploca sp. SIO2C1]